MNVVELQTTSNSIQFTHSLIRSDRRGKQQRSRRRIPISSEAFAANTYHSSVIAGPLGPRHWQVLQFVVVEKQELLPPEYVAQRSLSMNNDTCLSAALLLADVGQIDHDLDHIQ